MHLNVPFQEITMKKMMLVAAAAVFSMGLAPTFAEAAGRGNSAAKIERNAERRASSGRSSDDMAIRRACPSSRYSGAARSECMAKQRKLLGGG